MMEGAEPLARLQDVDTSVYLVDDPLVKTGLASMAHSLEARVPFLDPVVAELAHALPTRHKVRALAKKRLLRRAVAPLLPRAVVHGRKQGFSILADPAWLRGELAPLARETFAPTSSPPRAACVPRLRRVSRARAPPQRPRGPTASALGAALVHAVVRATRPGSQPRGRLVVDLDRHDAAA